MSDEENAKDFPNQIGKTKITVIDEGYTNAGIYVWQLPDGRFFTDGQNSVLNIPSMRGDKEKVKQLIQAAAYYGQPEGKAVFFAGTARITEEEYSVQLDRMKQGFIANPNDLGALIAAKKTLETYGTYED